VIFFLAYLHNSPEFHVALCSFCVLSSAVSLRAFVSATEIARITYCDYEHICDCMDWFVNEERRLVVKSEGEEGPMYQLSHDWLASSFRYFFCD